MPKRVLSGVSSVLLLILLVFLLSSLPILITAHKNGIVFQWSTAGSAVSDYIRGFVSGDSFTYFVSKNEHHFLKEAWDYLAVSLSYTAAAILAGLILSVFAGFAILRWKMKVLREALETLSVLPDFVVILMLQLFAVFLHQNFGMHVNIASFGDRHAILLPFLSITLVPFIYMLRQVLVQMQMIVTEDFIMLAKAKGLNRTNIYFYHVLPNLLAPLRAELPKLIGMVIGNLFIIEYLFNLTGITRLMFQKGAPFNLTVDCFLALFLLYYLVFAIGRISLWGLERITSR